MITELRRILAQSLVQTWYQPIIDGRGAVAVGYEALSRGPADSGLQAPIDLLNAATAEGSLPELDRTLLELAIQRFAQARHEGRLFLNVMPQTLLGHQGLDRWLSERFERAGLHPRDVVLELTEHGLADDARAVRNAVAPLRELGCEIAIDDLGAGSSGLKTWSEIRPDYVKVDRYFVAGIERDPVSAEVLRSVLDMAHVMGSRVIAEGVETAAQCASVIDLGVDYVQGYFLGYPQPQPRADTGVLRQLLGGQSVANATCAEQLAVPIPPAAPGTRIAEVVELFRRHKHWDSLAVVREGRPIGIVRRDDLFTLLSRPLYPEIFNRKPITDAMEAQPLIIDARSRLDQVSRLVTSSARARVNEDFIIARHGNYLGLGRTIELLRQITAQQVQAAKQSNPLTMLPGNRQIEEQASRLLALRSPFLMCHADIDHFKPYNDEYGYARGDQVLLHFADLLKRFACPRVDFVGHLGGDDFILVMRSADWLERLRRIFDSFAASVANFYRVGHRQAGVVAGIDREGAPRKFPLMTLSVAAVQACGERYATTDQVADRLRLVKGYAKARRGHALFVDSGDSVAEVPVSRPTMVGGTRSDSGGTGVEVVSA